MKNKIVKLEKANKVLSERLDETNIQALTLLGENEYLKSVNKRLTKEIEDLRKIIMGVKNEKGN